jgi:orotate phosphoribosyltransferase
VIFKKVFCSGNKFQRSTQKKLLVKKAIRYSDTPVFKLTSGKMNNFYIDCRKVTHNAEEKYLIGDITF